MSTLRIVVFGLVACGLFTTPPPTFAEPLRCRKAIAKIGAAHARIGLAARAKCEGKVVMGTLPPATDCTLEPKTAATLAKAALKVDLAVAKACGGADRICGAGGDDDALATIGWDIGTCPGLVGATCTDPIEDCGDVAACLRCIGDGSAETLRALTYDGFDLASPDGSSAVSLRSVGRSPPTRTRAAKRSRSAGPPSQRATPAVLARFPATARRRRRSPKPRSRRSTRSARHAAVATAVAISRSDRFPDRAASTTTSRPRRSASPPPVPT